MNVKKGAELSEIDSGGNAFPYCVWVGDHHNGHNTGMTLREWYAGMALQGMIASGDANDNPVGVIAQEAYKLADAMIRAGKGE